MIKKTRRSCWLFIKIFI